MKPSAGMQAIADGRTRAQVVGDPIFRHGSKTMDTLFEVAEERERQEKLVAAGKFSFTCASPLATDHDKLPILGEEFGEVCKELCDHRPGYRRRLRTELIQVAAVATAWAESLREDAR